MLDDNEKRRIAQEVFAITGVAVAENDPLVLAALFYAHKMQEAARQAAGQITTASASTRSVVQDAAEAVRKATASNKALVDMIDARFQKGLRQVAKSQSTHGTGSSNSIRLVFGAFMAGAVAVVLGIAFASGFSYSWMQDAADGRAFNRVRASLDPGTRAKIMAQLKKDIEK